MEKTAVRKIIFTLCKDGQYVRKAYESVIQKSYNKFGMATNYRVVSLPDQVRDRISQGWALTKYKGESLPGKEIVKGGGKKKGKKQSQKGNRKGNNKSSGLSPVRFDPEKEVPVNIQKIADILNRLVPGAGEKSTTISKYNVDVIGLLQSYDKGENPLDYLSRRVDSERKPRVLITPDFSQSCNADADLFGSVAEALSKNTSIQVFVESNFNGNFNNIEDVEALNYDLALYIGDDDVFYSGGTQFMSLSCTNKVILSNFGCNGTEAYKEIQSSVTVLKAVKYAEDCEDIIKALELV